MNTPAVINCKMCGDEFTRTSNSNKYCDKCKKRIKERKKAKKIYTCQCKNCGKIFDSKTKKDYCNTACEESYNQINKPVAKTVNGGKSLDEMAKLCRMEGLSYGQYLTKYGY